MSVKNQIMLITYADRGFAPMTYETVNHQFGSRDDKKNYLRVIISCLIL
jgi:hypothetical protein